MNKQLKNNLHNSKLILEELEERRVLELLWPCGAQDLAAEQGLMRYA